MTEIVSQGDRDLALGDEARRLLKKGVAENTRRGYGADRATFNGWCAATGRTPLPATAQTLAEYVTALALAGLAPATIRRAMTSIRTMHQAAGLAPPVTKAALTILRGYVRDGAPRAAPADPLLIEDLRRLVETCDPDTVAGARDRALLVLGWTMMARRSELAELDVEDVRVSHDWLRVTVRRSKTDQDGVGAVVEVPRGEHAETCPVRLVEAWLAVLGETTGPLFRPVDRHGRMGGDPRFAGRAKGARMAPQAVEVVMRRAVLRAGLTGAGAAGPRLTPHSMRAGGATQSYEDGASPLAIARHGRWLDGSRVLLGYIRTVDKRRDNPMRRVGL